LRFGRLSRAAILGLVSCAAAAAQDTATEAIEDCLSRFEEVEEEEERETEPALKDIESQCPELKSILEHSPYAAWFPEQWWHSQLSTGSLTELQAHIAHESAAHEARTLDISGVGAALESLETDRRASKVTWWDRLREWLRSRLKPEEEEPPTWLFKWLDELGRHEMALRIIGYSLYGLIVIAALWIVINELRAAGVFGAGARRRARAAGALASARAKHELTLADVESSDPANRPSLLLTLLLAALARREDRMIDDSTTHRELATRVTLTDSAQRMTFGRLVRCAERVRYGATLPTRGEIDEVVGDARRLLDSFVSGESAPA
jgi:hypothetical protein